MKATVGARLRDYAIAAACALAIATCAFVGVRNRELEARQLEVARRAAAALAEHREPESGVRAAFVSAATPSPAHPYLRHRQIEEHGAWRVLAGGAAAQRDDKLFYDAANRVDRDGAFAELVSDGSGRAIAAVRELGGVAVAITDPARPAPYPWLVMIGVLGLGAALAAAGALVGPRAARAGAFAGILTLAVPTMIWHAWLAAGAIAGIAAALAAAQRAELTDQLARGMRRHRVAFGFLAPAAVSMLILVAAPFIIGIALGFYEHHHGTWTFVGLDNFWEILSGGGRALEDPLNFWFILGVTVLWTVANVALHVTIGVMLALVLSRTWLRGRGIFRMLLILPWAIPNYITALIWHGMFRGQDAAINSLLHAFGLSGVSWFDSWATSFSANVVTNTWLGFPFMMVVALGSIWTFNMFNVIYLVSGGKPGDSTNILVTDAYRWAFERGNRYGMAAAEATIIFLILLLWTVFGARVARTKEDA